MEVGDEIIWESLPFLRIYRSGRVERSMDGEAVPATVDPAAGVLTKDVVISPETGVSARLYVPNVAVAAGSGGTQEEEKKKLPLLVYYHGGGFCLGNPFMPTFHNFLNSLVARANVVAVSVGYRLAPEHPIPAAYDDSWEALQWVVAQANGGPGAERWLAERADFDRLFLAGESAGGNIVHHMAMRGEGLGVNGIVIIHPYFLGSDPVESAAIDPEVAAKLESLWRIACPTAEAGVDDPMINPVAEGSPSLAGLGCKRVLICLGGEDVMRDRGRAYCCRLRESGWGGKVELYETVGKGHGFHLRESACDEGLAQDMAICRFLNQQEDSLCGEGGMSLRMR